MCAVSFICYILVSGWLLICDGLQVESNTLHIHDPKDTEVIHSEEITQTNMTCDYLDLEDVVFREHGNIYLKNYDMIMPPTRSYIMVDDDRICFNRSEEVKQKILEECLIIRIEPGDFEIFPNDSILLKPESEMLESATYKVQSGTLLTCDKYEDNSTTIMDKPEQITTVEPVPGQLATVGPEPRITKDGNSVSVIAPIAYLIALCIISSLFVKGQ